ncbi:unnamed protein product [Ascophyllum nodosum]
MARGPSRCRSRYMARGPGFAAGAVQGARRRRSGHWGGSEGNRGSGVLRQCTGCDSGRCC